MGGSFLFLRQFFSRAKSELIATAVIVGLMIAVSVPFATRLVEMDDIVMLAGVSVALIFVVHAFAHHIATNTRLLMWRVGLILWAFLLSAEQFFLRPMTSAMGAADSSFAGAAYAEAGTWLVCALVIFVVIVRVRGSFPPLWSNNFRFVWLFVAWCFVSSFYSPARLLALAWVFKLTLAVLALQMCSFGIRNRNDIRTFLLANFWGFLLLTILPVIHGIITGQRPFGDDGRLDYFDHPVHGSQWAGITLLLALIVFEGRVKMASIWVIICAAIMLASGGKAGTLAALICGTMLIILRRNVRHALLLVFGLGVITWTVFSFTPVSRYIEDYSDSGAAISLTGRTTLWSAAMPMIMQKPIFGHGYMSSRFISQSNDLQDFNWEPSQLHNSFLEITYTGGIVGLMLLLGLHYRIGKRLWPAVKSGGVGAAAGVLYMNVLLQSWVEGSVAGKATDNFLLLIALVMLSEKIVHLEPLTDTSHFLRAEVATASVS
jgi:O-antigen ligase